MVEFEHGPYSIRSLWVVYSDQEDMTFLSWRIGEDADPRRVVFELDLGAGFSKIDLRSIPFPADPFECDEGLCFQYQLPGQVDLPPDTRPLRSVHDIDGPLIGPKPRLYRANTTFTASPFPLYANTALEIGIDSWFVANRVPLERDFEWQLVEASRPRSFEDCMSPEGRWLGAQPVVDLDGDWLDAYRCLALRPNRLDRASPHALIPIEAAAETRIETRRYTAPVESAPIAFGILFDMEVPNDNQCQEIKRVLSSHIESRFSERGRIHNLGAFFPLEPDSSDPMTGCSQDPRRRLPVADMIEAVMGLEPLLDGPYRVLWLYVNNLSLPLDRDIAEQLGSISDDTAAASPARPYMLALGSSAVLWSFNWSHAITWRGLHDETMAGDIAAFTERTLPFRTMMHSSDTLVPIEPPPGATPDYFKLCEPSPTVVDRVGSGEVGLFPWPEVLPWPTRETPHFTIGLGSQFLVPYESLFIREVVYRLEVCDAYCDRMFRLSDKTVVPSWLDDTRCRRMEDGEG